MRAMWAHKDPFTRAVFGIGLKPRDEFLQGLRSTDGTFPSVYWDGTRDPAELGLDDGGVVVYNLVEQDASATLEVLITTGSAAHPETYTCFGVTLDIARGYIADANSAVDDEPEPHCAPEIVETLGSDAQLYPMGTFTG